MRLIHCTSYQVILLDIRLHASIHYIKSDLRSLCNEPLLLDLKLKGMIILSIDRKQIIKNSISFPCTLMER